jgi:hypothetical protein
MPPTPSTTVCEILPSLRIRCDGSKRAKVIAALQDWLNDCATRSAASWLNDGDNGCSLIGLGAIYYTGNGGDRTHLMLRVAIEPSPETTTASKSVSQARRRSRQ